MITKASVVTLAFAIAACSGPTSSSNNEALTGPAETKPKQSAEVARNGPFGFDMGQSIEGLGLKELDKPNLYSTEAPPKPHASFESVVLEAYPSVGICTIRGIGRNLDGDGAGSRVQAEVDDLSEALATKYGKGSKMDVCSGGDIQCENQFWMMTLNGGERFYGHSWERQNDAMKAAKIGEITVAARASDISTSYSVVEYISADKEGCGRARKGKSASSL